jgi:hypothetical protein
MTDLEALYKLGGPGLLIFGALVAAIVALWRKWNDERAGRRVDQKRATRLILALVQHARQAERSPATPAARRLPEAEPIAFEEEEEKTGVVARHFEQAAELAKSTMRGDVDRLLAEYMKNGDSEPPSSSG